MAAPIAPHQDTRPHRAVVPADFGRDLVRDIEAGRVRLPTLPETAMKIWEVVRSARTSTADVCRALERDPPLAARLLRAANSSAYSGAMPAVKLDQAVIRLGRGDVRNLVMATCTRDLYKPRSSASAATMSELWAHSLAVAIGAQRLTRTLDFPERDAAFVAGLLHDIGKIVVLTHAESLPAGRVPPAEMCRAVLDPAFVRLHAACGAGVMTAWRLPQSMVQVCLGVDTLDARGEIPPLVGVVHVADALARKLHVDASSKPVDTAALEAVARKLGLDEVILADVESELESRVAELNRAW